MRPGVDVAVELLKRELRDGEKPSALIYERAAERGIAPRMLRRAATRCGIKRRKAGYQGPWLWRRPSTNDERRIVVDRNGTCHYHDGSETLCYLPDWPALRHAPDELSPYMGGPASWCARCRELGG